MRSFLNRNKTLLLSAPLLLAIVAAKVPSHELPVSSSKGRDVANEPIALAQAQVSASKLIEKFCEQYWGELSQDSSVCRFEQTFHLNLTRAGESSVLTQIPLQAADTVTISAWNPPQAIVGPAAYRMDSNSFVARSEGYLAFRPMPGESFFSVQELRVDRCFAVSGEAVQAVTCPQIENNG